jgi:hypothetical protein
MFKLILVFNIGIDRFEEWLKRVHDTNTDYRKSSDKYKEIA